MKKRAKMRVYEFPVVIEKDEKDYYFAYAPSLQGCYTQGKTHVEALENIKEVIELHLADRRANGETIPATSLSAFPLLFVGHGFSRAEKT